MNNDSKNIVIGTTFIDIKGFPDSDYLETGRNAGSIEYVHGGVGRNIAENLGRRGCRPTFLSLVDHSSLSTDIIERLKKSGVETKYITRSDDGLGTWLAIFDSEGDLAGSISKQSDMHGLLPVMEQYESAIFSDAANLSVEFGMEPDVIAGIMQYARKYDLPVYAVICNMRTALEGGEFQHPVTCLVCNRQEAEIMYAFDRKVMTSDETVEMDETDGKDAGHNLAETMIRMIKEIITAYPIDKMVVTLGGDGAVYYDKEDGGSGWIPPIPVTVCDTTGAGDAFFSGVVMGLTRGDSLEEACKNGAQLASSVIATKENVCPAGSIGGVNQGTGGQSENRPLIDLE